MSDDMKPTPIEDPDARRRRDELRSQLDGSYSEIVEQIARRSVPDWPLLHAKMAHDNAMRRTLWSLDRQAHDQHVLGRIAGWTLGIVTVILLLIATQCTGDYGGHIIDDPLHYSRQP